MNQRSSDGAEARRPPQRGRRKPPRDVSTRPERNTADEEVKFHGRHACRAVFLRRPDDVIRVYVTQERLKEFGDLLKWCAEHRRAYHVVEPENLERVTETVHHQGIAVLARRLRPLNDAQLLEGIQAGRLTGPFLYLDGIQNPHNLGAILRTAAHFGVSAILGRSEELPGVSAAAARVAEGGAEVVPTARLKRPQEILAQLKSAQFRIFASTSHPGGNVYQAALPGRCVLILGNEVNGVSQELASLADASLQIPGTGAVESLNVSAACAVLLSEVLRRRASEGTSGAADPASPSPSRRSRGKSRRAR